MLVQNELKKLEVDASNEKTSLEHVLLMMKNRLAEKL